MLMCMESVYVVGGCSVVAVEQGRYSLASNPGFPFRILSHSIFLQSCETKSGMESLGSRLGIVCLVCRNCEQCWVCWEL